MELKRPPTASIGAELPDKQPQGRADRYEALMRAVSEGRRKQPVSGGDGMMSALPVWIYM